LWKLARTIDLACRVFVSRDSLRLLSESWSLSAMGIIVVRERGKVGGDEVGVSVFHSISLATSLLRIPNPAVPIP
jgi:hypothetical protein